MTDLASALLRGPRGRRWCLEYVAGIDEDVRLAMFWAAYQNDANPGSLVRFGDPEGNPDPDPRYTPDDIATLLTRVRVAGIDPDLARRALQMSVDTARYWQEPDGADVVAALPIVREALRPVAERLVAAIPRLDTPRAEEQWTVDWHSLDESAPLDAKPAVHLKEWAEATRLDEERSARERPKNPHARYSGSWWSVPTELLSTRGTALAALTFVEDAFNWETATVIPVEAAGRTLEITSPEDWADLCRAYPLDVTASRRHDWFRVTGRDGTWVIPDWQRVADDWDAVHLTTLGYLSAATDLIQIDAERASVIGGWAPDSTIWVRDVAREADAPRVEWERVANEQDWAPAV